MTDTDRMLAYVNGELDEQDEIAVIQGLIDSGEAWRLEGSIGRTAMGMIEAGLCTLGPVAHRDYYGNRVPSRDEVEPGTKGSPEFVENARDGLH